MKKNEFVPDQTRLNEYVSQILRSRLAWATDHEGVIGDSLRLSRVQLVEELYYASDYQPLWTDTGTFLNRSAVFLQFLDTALYVGLDPDAYAYTQLKARRDSLSRDSLLRRDAVYWACTELMLTDAFVGVAHDLKWGRLDRDSAHRIDDTTALRLLYKPLMQRWISGDTLSKLFDSIQPQSPPYRELRRALKPFVQQMDRKTYTAITFPFTKGDESDSLRFIRTLTNRLRELNLITATDSASADSLTLASAITRYQKKTGLVQDGKAGKSVVRMLNLSDRMKLKLAFVSLDKYKLLPDLMPQPHIWVNLPAFRLEVWDHDTLRLSSRIVCGKPVTPTPELTSAIYEMITYPTWTVPESIIRKEMLPGLKKNPNYLAKKGLTLLDREGNPVDPSTVNWTKYSKGIPYRIRQGSGDDNALGVLKFNFLNKHDVYLHDTNQRSLFGRSMRALSHGCVRVQQWDSLARLIARHDSTRRIPGSTLDYTVDSVRHWIAEKKRKRIAVKNTMPLFIRYLTCEGDQGILVVHEDIYGTDAALVERHFHHDMTL